MSMLKMKKGKSKKASGSSPYLLEEFAGNPLLPEMIKETGEISHIAIDIGYHGVKILTEEGLTFIPNVVCRRKDFGHRSGVDPKSIVYKTIEGQEYFVGELALDNAKDGDIKDNERYSLDFITTPEFLAIFRSAVYIATKGNPNPIVSTGLPSSAFKEDTKYVELLIDALAKEHKFQIAVGADVGATIKYKEVSFAVSKEDLFIYPQPIGTLASQGATVSDGEMEIVVEDLLDPTSRTVRTVIDGGFYTLDVHTMRKTNDILDKSFSYKGEGMIYPYRKIREGIVEHAMKQGYKPEYPIWTLSEVLEGPKPYLFDTSTEDKYDATTSTFEAYEEYAEMMADRVTKDLNKGTGIDEIYITGGPSFLLKESLSKEGRIPQRKVKNVECKLNGVAVQPRFFNVIGYFYLMAAALVDREDILDEVAASIEE